MERIQPSTSTAVSLFLACAPVRRVKRSKGYSPRDYEVYMVNRGLQSLSLPTWKARLEQEPSKLVLDNMQEKLGLFGTSVYPLAASCVPANKSGVTLFYAVPVSNEDVVSSGEGKYYNLLEVLEINEQFHLEEGARDMLTAVDQWLRERHTVPFVNVDTLFLCSREGEGIGGLVKAIIENPLHSSRLRPPEDNLVISLNNPVFEMSTTQDTTITSNA